MPRIADEPLKKVTLNLYESDVEWFQKRHGFGYTEVMRTILRQHRNKVSVAERAFEVQHEDNVLLFGEEDER